MANRHGNKTYGFCEAGCKYEVVSMDQFEQSAAYIVQAVDGSTNNKCFLEIGKTYRIYSDSDSAWGFTIYLKKDGITYNPFSTNFPTFDEYKKYITFVVLGVNATNVVFEINGVRTTYESSTSDLNTLELYVVNESAVTLINEDASLTAQTTFIRYATDSSGSNMSAVYNNQSYIGTYIGNEASTNASDYTWCLFKGADGLGVTKADFTIPAGGWTVVSASPYTYQKTITLSGVTFGETVAIKAYFDDLVASNGVDLYSATTAANGTDTVLVFYSVYSKSVALTGVIMNYG